MSSFIQQVFNGLLVGSSYALMAAGLTTIFGIMHVVNFAHGELYMLGAFMLFVFAVVAELPFLAAFALAILVVMAVGVAVERLAIRPIFKKGGGLFSTVLVTLGFYILLENLALIIWGPFPKSVASPLAGKIIRFGEISFSQYRLAAMIAAFIILICAHYFMKYTWVGRAMRATFQDLDAAKLVGIQIEKINTITFAFGAALAAAAGALLAPIFVIYPAMGGMATLKAFCVAIMGGLGNFMGAIMAGLVLGVAESLGAGYVSSGYRDAVGFLFLVLVLIFKPEGLFGKRGGGI